MMHLPNLTYVVVGLNEEEVKNNFGRLHSEGQSIAASLSPLYIHDIVDMQQSIQYGAYLLAAV